MGWQIGSTASRLGCRRVAGGLSCYDGGSMGRKLLDLLPKSAACRDELAVGMLACVLRPATVAIVIPMVDDS